MNAEVGATIMFNWAEILQALDPNQRFALILVVVAAVTTILITVPITLTCVLAANQRHRRETELKREMLDRGMTAEEIAAVVTTATPPEQLRKQAPLARM